MAKHLKVALIREKEVAHLCYSYCMVKSINDSLHVINDDLHFVHFVRQNYLAGIPGVGAAPVSAEVANPHELREKRNKIFKSVFVPKLKEMHTWSPAVFSAWINAIEAEKGWMMRDIQARYERVQDANATAAQHLQSSKKFAVAVTAAASGAVVLIGAGAALFGIGAVGLAAMGSASTAQALAAAELAGQAGMVSIFFNVAHLGVTVHRKMSEMNDAHCIAIVAEQAPVKVGSALTEHLAQIERGAELRVEMDGFLVEMKALMNDGSKKLNANWFVKQQAFAKASQQSARRLMTSGLCGVGVVLCAGLELREHYEQFEADWNDGAPHGGAHHAEGHH